MTSQLKKPTKPHSNIFTHFIFIIRLHLQITNYNGKVKCRYARVLAVWQGGPYDNVTGDDTLAIYWQQPVIDTTGSWGSPLVKLP